MKCIFILPMIYNTLIVVYSKRTINQFLAFEPVAEMNVEKKKTQEMSLKMNLY